MRLTAKGWIQPTLDDSWQQHVFLLALEDETCRSILVNSCGHTNIRTISRLQDLTSFETQNVNGRALPSRRCDPMVQQRVFIDHGARPSTDPPLTIISYNILADKYAVSGWHSYCPLEHLQWSSRLPRLIQELETYSADIICLQEVPPAAWGRRMPANVSK